MAPAQEEANHKREQDVLGVAILTSIADGSFVPYLLVLPVCTDRPMDFNFAPKILGAGAFTDG